MSLVSIYLKALYRIQMPCCESLLLNILLECTSSIRDAVSLIVVREVESLFNECSGQCRRVLFRAFKLQLRIVKMNRQSCFALTGTPIGCFVMWSCNDIFQCSLLWRPFSTYTAQNVATKTSNEATGRRSFNDHEKMFQWQQSRISRWCRRNGSSRSNEFYKIRSTSTECLKDEWNASISDGRSRWTLPRISRGRREETNNASSKQKRCLVKESNA